MNIHSVCVLYQDVSYFAGGGDRRQLTDTDHRSIVLMETEKRCVCMLLTRTLYMQSITEELWRSSTASLHLRQVISIPLFCSIDCKQLF